MMRCEGARCPLASRAPQAALVPVYCIGKRPAISGVREVHRGIGVRLGNAGVVYRADPDDVQCRVHGGARRVDEDDRGGELLCKIIQLDRVHVVVLGPLAQVRGKVVVHVLGLLVLVFGSSCPVKCECVVVMVLSLLRVCLGDNRVGHVTPGGIPVKEVLPDVHGRVGGVNHLVGGHVLLCVVVELDGIVVVVLVENRRILIVDVLPWVQGGLPVPGLGVNFPVGVVVEVLRGLVIGL